jgi:hypothetical protein
MSKLQKHGTVITNASVGAMRRFHALLDAVCRGGPPTPRRKRPASGTSGAELSADCTETRTRRKEVRSNVEKTIESIRKGVRRVGRKFSLTGTIR